MTCSGLLQVATLRKCLAGCSDPKHTNLFVRDNEENSVTASARCFEKPLTQVDMQSFGFDRRGATFRIALDCGKGVEKCVIPGNRAVWRTLLDPTVDLACVYLRTAQKGELKRH